MAKSIPDPDRYAVIGHPVEHSKSPDIHARFAAQTGQNLVYERLLAPLDGFAETVRTFAAQGGKGLNVTVPFKLEAYAIATEHTARAQAAGAVNTLKFDGDKILGDNTDGVGLVHDIVRNAGISITGKRVLLLGAGGAARGVILPLLNVRPNELVIANRTLSKAEQLAQPFQQQFAGQVAVRTSEFAGLQDAFDIIINATSASLSDEVPPLVPGLINEQSFAYDMMYGRQPTVFMLFAAEQGAKVRDGLGMLVEQAAESFFVWRGVRPQTAPVFSALRAQLS
jgi:shikimate dehydrogenase